MRKCLCLIQQHAIEMADKVEMPDEAIYNKLGKCELTGILIRIIDFRVENSTVLFTSLACISAHTLLCALLTA